MKQYILILSTLLLLPISLFAQSDISGTVTEQSSGEPIIGANLILLGTSQGNATDFNGNYVIRGVQPGEYTIRVSSVGYVTITEEITVGSNDLELDFELELTSASLTSLEVFASRSDQTTPVAFSNVDQQAIQTQLGSRNLPEVLNITPSVYATGEGGGAGDARINVI